MTQVGIGEHLELQLCLPALLTQTLIHSLQPGQNYLKPRPSRLIEQPLTLSLKWMAMESQTNSSPSGLGGPSQRKSSGCSQSNGQHRRQSGIKWQPWQMVFPHDNQRVCLFSHIVPLLITSWPHLQVFPCLSPVELDVTGFPSPQDEETERPLKRKKLYNLEPSIFLNAGTGTKFSGQRHSWIYTRFWGSDRTPPRGTTFLVGISPTN